MYKIGIVDDFAVWSKMAYEYVNEYILNKKLNCIRFHKKRLIQVE